jgi:hypothetical protein
LDIDEVSESMEDDEEEESNTNANANNSVSMICDAKENEEIHVKNIYKQQL